MTETNKITASGIFHEHGRHILSRWMDEVRQNPHFNHEDFAKKDQFSTYSRTFLSSLLDTVEKGTLPDISRETFDPILKIWHRIMKELGQGGFSTKDTAMFVFSLKTSLVNFIKDHDEGDLIAYGQELGKLNHMLDILGLLTFEIYTAENDRLIHRQKEQIHYLEMSRFEGKFGRVIGASPQMHAVFRAIGLVLENDVTVLLEGESGTGKDVIANIIHQHSNRKNKPLITVNCGAIPHELIESELFGHEKGSFTGALDKKLGKFELAHGGTLFLDEIGELEFGMQVKLLRAIQNREIERVGGTEKISIDVRIIAATNKHLKKMVDEHKFRLDLYYRLNVFPIEIPPLRERKSDIVPLAEHFLDRFTTQFSTEPKQLSLDAESWLLNQKWEGNIRELENLMQRAVIMSAGSIITVDILQSKPGHYEEILLIEGPKNTPAAKGSPTAIIPLDDLEKTAIENAIKTTGGNIRQAAQALGISRTTFYNKAKKYQIEVEEARE